VDDRRVGVDRLNNKSTFDAAQAMAADARFATAVNGERHGSHA
jgi:hypothetical protein